MTYIMQRDFADAIHEFETARKISSPEAYVGSLLGCAQALSGNTAAQTKSFKASPRDRTTSMCRHLALLLYTSGFGIATVHLNWLEKAYQYRSSYMAHTRD
jgi:hypothetical protein